MRKWFVHVQPLQPCRACRWPNLQKGEDLGTRSEVFREERGGREPVKNVGGWGKGRSEKISPWAKATLGAGPAVKDQQALGPASAEDPRQAALGVGWGGEATPTLTPLPALQEAESRFCFRTYPETSCLLGWHLDAREATSLGPARKPPHSTLPLGLCCFWYSRPLRMLVWGAGRE